MRIISICTCYYWIIFLFDSIVGASYKSIIHVKGLSWFCIRCTHMIFILLLFRRYILFCIFIFLEFFAYACCSRIVLYFVYVGFLAFTLRIYIISSPLMENRYYLHICVYYPCIWIIFVTFCDTIGCWWSKPWRWRGFGVQGWDTR